ncbi:hypothetical protein MSAN_02285900 [Mycena sanguinolenta]|uniref:F-box domain-containing protein n=1 Tax=Mycena sanguinolenta TaxID=230812 RepID=A0A8H7CIF0_9AGAR|nr:hypothetical protein MSAN_02285900 [Mycena sanguinolenta]
MASACSECGAFVIPSGDDFELNVTTVPRTLARFVQLSATNEPPLEAELAIIRPIVEKTSGRLVSLEAEISRLTARLRELKEERAVLLRYHVQNTSIASAVRRIPAEILGEIFSHTLPSIHFLFGAHNSPWVLTQVCSRWRAIASSRPSLWSWITLDFSVQQHYSLELVKIHIGRARSLKIHFFGSQDCGSDSQIALFKLLAEHSAQWEELNLQLTSHLLPYVHTLPRDLTALRRARVNFDTPESQPPDFETVDFFRMAISLIDIGVFCRHRFLPTRLPLMHQLTRYDFDAPWSTHSELLKSLPNLREVRLHVDFDDEDWPEAGEPISLLHLRRLFVNDSSSLDYLRAPGLEEIAILGDATENTETCVDLESFLTRSACSPRRLCLRGFLDESLTNVLEKHPSFTEVAVMDAEDDDEREILSSFVTRLSNSNSTPSALSLPHITAIGFASLRPDTVLYRLLVNMLESRWNAGQNAFRAAELLLLESHARPDPQSAARIEKLRAAGLQISILSEDEATVRANRWMLRAQWSWFVVLILPQIRCSFFLLSQRATISVNYH